MAIPEHDEIKRAGLRFQIDIHEQVLLSDPSDADSLRFLANAYGLIGKPEERLNADQRLTAIHPSDPRAFYNLACSFAILGRPEEALDGLGKAVALGFRDAILLRRDTELDALRDEPRFQQLALLISD